MKKIQKFNSMSVDKYSFKKNIKYVGEVFYNPKLLVRHLNLEPKLSHYIILPFLLFTLGYEILYIRAFLIQEPLIPLPLIFNISETDYRLFEVIFFPLIHISCFFVALLVFYAFSKKYKGIKIDLVKIFCFFGFVGNTIGLVALGLDIIAYIIPCEFCAYIHPICGLAYGIYLVYFVHEHSGLSKKKAIMVTIMSLAAFFSFRMLLIR